MVSKASEDLPEPDSPVITTSWSRGSSRSIALRLCSRAPRTTIRSLAMDATSYPQRRAGQNVPPRDTALRHHEQREARERAGRRGVEPRREGDALHGEADQERAEHAAQVERARECAHGG